LEEENRAADVRAEVVFFIRRLGAAIREVALNSVVADVFVSRAVEFFAATLGRMMIWPEVVLPNCAS
jgi:hypothetical protein